MLLIYSLCAINKTYSMKLNLKSVGTGAYVEYYEF